MAQKTQIKAYEKYYERMVHCLPMNDARFVAKLYSHQLLPGDTESQLETKTTPAAKAAYFLSRVVKRALDGNDTSSFNNLLSVMESCDYADLNKLAYEIKSKINKASDTEPGIVMVLIYTCMYLWVYKSTTLDVCSLTF